MNNNRLSAQNSKTKLKIIPEVDEESEAASGKGDGDKKDPKGSKKSSPKSAKDGKKEPKSAKDAKKEKKSAKDGKKGKDGSMYVPPMDALIVKVISLRLPEETTHMYAVNVTFSDQYIITSIIKPMGMREETETTVQAKGTIVYDPSDYEKMALFADHPLVVNISPLKDIQMYEGTGMQAPMNSTEGLDRSRATKSQTKTKAKSHTDSVAGSSRSRTPSPGSQNFGEVSCCNIDILPLFIYTDKMCVHQRMQPMITPSILYRKSWSNLPLLTLSITAVRHEDNESHHRFLRDANWIKISLVGHFNMIAPFNSDCYYFAATKNTTFSNVDPTKLATVVTFSEGFASPPKMNYMNLRPKWESLRNSDLIFAKGDEKLLYNIEDIYNPDNLPNIEECLKGENRENHTIWGSFHRSLLMAESEKQLYKWLQRWKWPLELHSHFDGTAPLSQMGFLDMFPLLHAGVDRMVIAVPLRPHSARLMAEACNCDALTSPSDIKKYPSFATPQTTKKNTPAKGTTPRTPKQEEHLLTSLQELVEERPPSFVIVEVLLGRPLTPEFTPPLIRKSELMEMLQQMEHQPVEARCKGRGQLARNFRDTVVHAAAKLRMVPQQAMTEIVTLNRQLSETRTRVEIMSSFIMEASIFVNNNFVVPEYLASEGQYQELLRMAHVCLMQVAVLALFGRDRWHDMNAVQRAARHARQVTDVSHANELFTQVVADRPFDGDYWRELATCLKDTDRGAASCCLSKALALDIRHPLTIVSQGCMVFADEDPNSAEPFFVALLGLYPLWSTAYYICFTYYTAIEMYRMANEVMKSLEFMKRENMLEELHLPRTWEKELGDFWEPIHGMQNINPFYDTVDLLLRLRAVRLAEVCLSIALAQTGPNIMYYHLVALCSRLQGDLDNAICLARQGMAEFGDASYLRIMEGECLYQKGDRNGALEVFSKFALNPGANTYNVLMALPSWDPNRVRSALLDLLRREPSAYGWMALANDWRLRAQLAEKAEGDGVAEKSTEQTAHACAAACAVRALKWDRRCGPAWALLATLAQPLQRREYCADMARLCGHPVATEDIRARGEDEGLCHRLGTALRDCRCHHTDTDTLHM